MSRCTMRLRNRVFLALLAMLFLAAVRPAVAGWEDVDLTGTRPGPSGFFMTKAEKAEFTQRARTVPEGKAEFERLKIIADKVVAQEFNDSDLVACAKVYLVTQDEKYLNVIREMFMFYENRWFYLYGPGKKLRKQISGGWVWGINGGVTGNRYASQVYDLIADKLPPEEERRARAWIKDCLDGLREWFEAEDLKEYVGTSMNSNMTSVTVGRWTEWAVAISYDNWINWAIENPGKGPRYSAGFTHWLGQGHIIDNRIWHETPEYGCLFMEGVVPMAQNLSRYGRKNLLEVQSADGSTMGGLLEGMIATTYPAERTGPEWLTFRRATWGESGTRMQHGSDVHLINDGYSQARAMAAIYRITREPKYEWFLSMAKTIPKNVKLPKEVSPPPAPCSVFPNAGIVMLRNTETPDYWLGDGPAVLMRGGEQLRTSPGDTLSIRLHGAGRLLYADNDTNTYESFPPVGWKRSTIKQSTVCVDGREGWFFSGIYRKGFHPEVKYASVRGSRHGNDELERALMVTEDYVLDLFRVRVHKERRPWANFRGAPRGYHAGHTGAPLPEKEARTFDWMLHGLGRQFPDIPSAYAPSTDLRGWGWAYRWIAQERKRDTDGSFFVDWVQQTGGVLPGKGLAGKYQPWFEYRAAVRMRMIGESGTSVYLGEGPIGAGSEDVDENPERRIPLVAVRRTGVETLFAALHEPYRTAPKIGGFEYLHRLDKGEENPAVGVKVTCPEYIDRLYLSFGQPGFRSSPMRDPQKEIMTGKRAVMDITKQWLFKTDPEKVGQNANWFATDHDRGEWRKIDAGVNWQKFEKGYYGSAWYARTFTMPEELAGRKAYILFDGIDEDAWVYLNGKLVKERWTTACGDLWKAPILVDISESADRAGENLVVVKVSKEAFQTGIYLPVKIVTDAELVEKAPVLKDEPVETKVVTDYDLKELITFTGEAYVRHTGAKLIVRGDIKGFCILAADVPAEGGLMLNGKATAYHKVGAYVRYGNASVRKGFLPPPPVVEEPAGPRIELALPQRYVNLDAQKGGWLVARVRNLDAGTVSGRILLTTDAALKANAAEAVYGSLNAEQYVEKGFRLTPTAQAKSGSLASVTLRVYVTADGAGEQLIAERKVEVAIGVVVQKIEESYRMPKFEYPDKQVPGKQIGVRVDTLDYLFVRAPAYSARLDLYSGICRWIMDPIGKLRFEHSFYPYVKARPVRTKRYGAHTIRRGSGPIGEPVGGEGFDWLLKAELLKTGTNAAGQPTAKFRSASGNQELTYTFAPDVISLNGGRVDLTYHVENGTAPVRTTDSTIGFGIPDQAWWQEEPKSMWPIYRVSGKRAPDAVAGEGEEGIVLISQDFEKMTLGPAAGQITVPEGMADAFSIVDRGFKSKRSLRIDLTMLAGKRDPKGPWGGDIWLTIPVAERREGGGPGTYTWTSRKRHEAVSGITRSEPFYTSHGNTQYNPSWWEGGTRAWFLDCPKYVRPSEKAVPLPRQFGMRCPGDADQKGILWIDNLQVTYVPE